MLILSEKDVKSLLDFQELIEALEKAYVQFSTGRAIAPVRLVMPVPQITGRLTSMPAFLSADNALGMKVVTYFPENAHLGLPIIGATISLYSPESGRITVLMDGSYITAIRTACASAMATKALANPETPVMGLLGAGVQARAQIRVLSQVGQMRHVKVYDPMPGSGDQLKTELESEVGVEIEVVPTAKKAVQEADLLVTVTTANEPILDWEWLKPGVHINAVGSHRPDQRELDAATVKGARLVVDSRSAILAECGDILMAIQEGAITEDQVDTEIGHVLAGLKQGRTNPQEVTLYKSVGIAFLDVATAALVYQKAQDGNVGTQVEL